MPNYYATPITALASKKVRYVGEAVVAVIAEDRYLAEDALELIDIEYALLGAVTDPELALSRDAPLLHEEAATNVLIAREFKKGDAGADLAAAHVRVRDRFQMTRKAALAIEPRSYCAEFESRRDSITLYTSSNIPGIVRDALAESLDLPGSRLRVVAPDVGGSFGSKGSLYPEEILLCVAAKKLRRSLKWTADRLEDISSSSQAFAEIVDAEITSLRPRRTLLLAQLFVFDSLRCGFKTFDEARAVPDDSGRRAIWKFVRLDNIAPAYLKRVDAERPGSHIHQAFCDERGNRPADTAIGSGRRLVGRDASHRTPVRPDPVRPRKKADDLHRLEPACPRIDRVGADIADHIGFQRNG